MSAVDYCICIEELARVDPGVALSVAAHNGLCSAHIAMFGTEAQKQRYLVPLARGEKLGAWGADRIDSGQRRGGHADDRRARRRELGAERVEDVHHARRVGRCLRGDGGHRPRGWHRRASRRSSSSAARRA